MNWFMICMQKYATFDGRARRKEYWMFYLFYILIVFVAAVVDGMIGNQSAVVASLASLALLLPFLAVTVRRLHDTDRSGWWVLIGLIPLIGGLVLFIFACLDGTEGDNRFGSDPKADE